MRERKFTPGFRLSMFDAVILVVGLGAAMGLALVVWWWGFLVAFVLGHFFLFCNAFRLSRPLELIWAGAFMALAAPSIIAGMPGWPITSALSLVVTLVVAIVEMRKPSYHGVGWQRINPALPAWWKSQAANVGDEAVGQAHAPHETG
jgi:hypothetical protein